jgi:hypothetical protein
MARQLCYAASINENCLNWNDYIDVSVQDSENGTLYVGDAVGVEIFFLVAVESDGGICKDNYGRTSISSSRFIGTSPAEAIHTYLPFKTYMVS